MLPHHGEESGRGGAQDGRGVGLRTAFLAGAAALVAALVPLVAGLLLRVPEDADSGPAAVPAAPAAPGRSRDA
ncbi:hypothetical protein GCM10010182_75790 [Actinomadura cremea]|nr:hypothetical protein GCM10010182_75790 [Actinomadura cremea]